MFFCSLSERSFKDDSHELHLTHATAVDGSSIEK